MKLDLFRESCTPDRTEGRFSVNGVFLGYSLEPPTRAQNPTIEHPAVQTGTFQVVIGWSSRFQRQVPRIEGIPGRTNIEIHPLNFAKESLGCIGLGKQRSGASILRSADAIHELMAQLVPACVNQETVTITIEDLVGEDVKPV